MAGSDPSYTTCPLCWQSLNSSCVTLVEDGSPAGTDVHRMNSSKPGSEKTNARLMISLPVFLRLIHVSEGIKTIAPAWTSRSCVPNQTCALPVWINKISSWPRCLCSCHAACSPGQLLDHDVRCHRHPADTQSNTIASPIQEALQRATNTEEFVECPWHRVLLLCS